MLTAGPTLAAIPNQTLSAGAPLEIPINASSPSGYTLSYTVSSTNSAISADLQTGNPDLVLDISHTASSQAGDTSFSGVVEIELFPTAAPNTVKQIENLVNSDAYNGIDFYRIVPGFVAQAGLDGATPPTNADVQTLDDEFDPVLPVADPTQPLQYTSAGVVGLARMTADDTGSTEFFITTTATSSNLDYQYTVFGQVVSGMNILTDIGNVPNNASDNNLPYSPVTITTATITTDNNDFALGLSAPVGTTTSGSVTVNVNDGNGGTTSQTFQVTVQPDANDPGPILKSIATTPSPVTTTVNTPVDFQLSAFDLEGDPETYYDQTGLESSFGLSPTQAISSDLDVSVNASTGMVTVTPTNGLVGLTPMFFGVASSATPSYAPNTQMVPLFIDPAAPTGISLEPASDTGASNSDDITSLNNSSPSAELQFLVTGVTPGDEVIVFDGTQQIGEALASTTSVMVTTDGSTMLADGSHQITAEQALENQQYTVGNATGTTTLTSTASSVLSLTVDAAGPTFTSTPSFTATVESPYSYTAQASDSVSTGLTYALVSGPVGFSINGSTGAVTWTPTVPEDDDNSVEISVTDLAGNTVDQSFTVAASFGPLGVASITPSDGSTNVLVNSAILVQFNNPMNAATLDSTTLLLQDSGGNSIAATITYDATTAAATLTPNAPLANSTQYTVTIVSGAEGVADSNGDTLSSNVTASFTTETPLTVASVTPTSGSTAVPINTSIAVKFDNPMNASTLDSSTLVLEDSKDNIVATTVNYNATTNTATITPSASLANSTTYTLTVTSGADGVADTEGDILASTFTSSFTTAAVSVVSGTPVSLAKYFNLIGITTDGQSFSGGVDGVGNALSSSQLGSSVTFDGLPFTIGAVGGLNVVQSRGQSIALSGGSYSALTLLMTGFEGNQPNQTFVVHYTDGSTQTITQSISGWYTPQGYAGESSAVAMSHSNTHKGGEFQGTSWIYGYDFILNSSKTVSSITLPDNSHVVVLAMDLVGSVGAPSELTATLASGEVNLSWTSPGGAITGYNLYRGTTAGGESSTPLNATPLSASTTTSFQDTSVVAGDTYYYVVRAIYGPAVSADSTEASAIVPATATTTGAATQVDLAGTFNLVGITPDGQRFGTGLDGGGNALSGHLLGSSLTAGGVKFNIGAVGSANVVQSLGQAVSLPAGSFSKLDLLATGVDGNQPNQTFVVHYTDDTSQTFTQSLSDWYTPQGYAGESVAQTMDYRNRFNSGRDRRTFRVYDYSFNLDGSKTVSSITLPDNGHVEVLAITAVL